MNSGSSKARIEISGRMTSRGADRVATIYAASILVLSVGVVLLLLVRATTAQ